MTTYETQVEYDLAESGIHPLTTAELLAFDPDPDQRADELLNLPLNYSEARGTLALRIRIAETYARPDAGRHSRDDGRDRGELPRSSMRCSQPGDHVVAVYPAYQQLYTVPEAIGCDCQRVSNCARRTAIATTWTNCARLVDDRTRMIVINTPHNPTGAALSAAECAAVYAHRRIGRRICALGRGVSLDHGGRSAARRRRCATSGRARSASARSQSPSASPASASAGWPRRRRSPRAAGHIATTPRSARAA